MNTPAGPDASRGTRRDAYGQMSRLELIAALRARDRDKATPQDILIRRPEEQQAEMKLQGEQLSETHAGLKLTRHRFADLYDMAPVGYATFDEKGYIREINRTASGLLGRPTAQLLGKPFIPCLAKTDHKLFLEHLSECGRAGKQAITTLRLSGRDGVDRQIEFITRPAHDFEGKPGWYYSAMVDVTGRRATVAALAASETKFRLLAEHIGEVFWFAELDPPRVTYVSPAFERVWGFPPSDIYADSNIWMKVIHPDDIEVVRSAFNRWIKSEAGTFDSQYRVIHRDGSVHWIADRGIVVSRRNGRPFEISGIARDITERKRSEQKFHGLLEAAPDAMIIVDADGVIQLVNAQAMRLFGYERDEMVGQVVEMLVPDPLRERHVQHRKNFIAAPHTRNDILLRGLELHGRHKDGSEFPAAISLSPLETSEGLLIISAVRDITGQKQAEEKLRSAWQFAESTLEAVPASLAVLDRDGTVLSTNKAWTDFARGNGGSMRGGAVGSSYLAVCDAAAASGAHDAARFAAGIRAVMSGASSRFSMEYASPSGDQQQWFVGYVTPFLGGGAHCVVVHVDISERKRAELVIRRLNEELESRVEQRTMLLTVVNEQLRQEFAARRKLEEEILEVSEREQQRIGQDLHDDLGQQLAGAWMMSIVLERELARRKAPELKSATDIKDLLKRAVAMTRSLARGLHPVAPEPGGLMAALRDLTVRVIDMFNIDCRFDCAADVHVGDNTTATHLYRIAQEAVSNGVRHGRARNVLIGLSSDPRTTTLTVTDDGSGIGPLDPNIEGMGLRIMRYRADMIGATIKVEKQKDGGTCVTCTFPTPTPSTSNEVPHGKDIPRQEGVGRQKRATRKERAARKKKGAHRR